jgi:hypothetical protein
VLFVAAATATVSRAARVVVVEYDIKRRAVLDDILEVGMEVLDCVHAIVRRLRRRPGTYAWG